MTNRERAIKWIEEHVGMPTATEAPDGGETFPEWEVRRSRQPSRCQECTVTMTEEAGGANRTLDGKWICGFCFAAGGHVRAATVPRSDRPRVVVTEWLAAPPGSLKWSVDIERPGDAMHYVRAGSCKTKREATEWARKIREAIEYGYK